eukprot:119458-Rhodomonas_salina.1
MENYDQLADIDMLEPNPANRKQVMKNERAGSAATWRRRIKSLVQGSITTSNLNGTARPAKLQTARSGSL